MNCGLTIQLPAMATAQKPKIVGEGLTYDDVLARDLKVADATAISLCRDNALPIVVFNLLQEGNIARACRGERIGTLVSLET